MSTKNVMKNNSIKISGRESFQNSRNPRDIRSPTKKVSFLILFLKNHQMLDI